MSEGIELRVRAPQRGDSERLLGEEEGGFDEEGGVAGAGVGHQDGLDWERDHEDDDDDVSGGDLLRDIDSKRKKRNVAEPYYYQSQRKVTPLSLHSKRDFLFIQKMLFCWCGGGAGGDRGAGGARDDPAGAAERDGRIQDGSS
jgi:hypothetical protein